MSRACSANGRRRRHGRQVALLLPLAVVIALACGGAIDPLQTGVLTMLPALAVLAIMIVRPYLGERLITRLRARRPRRRRAPLLLRPRARLPEAGPARGGRLIAASLAGRAPPAGLAVAR